MKNASLFLAGAVAALCVATPALAMPLITIRFDRANVNYEGALYAAVKGALDRQPNASFDVVACSPEASTPGAQALAATNVRRNAESVVRSLTNMGLSANRIRVSQRTCSDTRTAEVRVFVI